MDQPTTTVSLLRVLTVLYSKHVEGDTLFQAALSAFTKGSTHWDQLCEGDPPIWEPTAWDAAVRWLAARSKVFHGLAPEGAIGEVPIETYGRLLRDYVGGIKRGGPSRSNPAAAELLDLDRQGLGAELCIALGEASRSGNELAVTKFQTKPKRGGRKKADYETIQREAKLAADWNRARDAKACSKAEFARDRGMSLKEFKKLLDRVATRKPCSE